MKCLVLQSLNAADAVLLNAFSEAHTRVGESDIVDAIYISYLPKCAIGP